MKRFALIGNPLGHSLSPQIHEHISEVSGLPCAYSLHPLEKGEVRPFLDALRGGAGALDGVNVTIPYKLEAHACMDALSPEAKEIGAVNTVAVDASGALVGHNTDCHGFGAMLTHAGIDARGLRCVVLGGGGSARAAVAYLRQAGAGDIWVVSRDASSAAARFPGVAVAGYGALDGLSGGLLVNCTPLGMHPHTEGCPADEAVIGRFDAAADLVYNPLETVFLRRAARLGLRRAGGLMMLVAQAVRAREIWHGRPLGPGAEAEVYRRMAPSVAGVRRSIVLIGMAGSGKTTVGRALARRLGRPFVDVDDVVTARFGSIDGLFAQGEAAFRRCETEAVRIAAETAGAVIATGGGVVTRPENMELLGRAGLIVFIDRPVDRIVANIDLASRPLYACGVEALQKTYVNRLPLYRQYAGCTIANDGTVEDACDRIIACVGEGTA